jgi:RNA-directed DNA polymerase
VLRAHIPKDPAKKETRPIGIPTFKDKVLQRAWQMVLEPLYEQEFLDCSYGFRTGRSAHGALQSLWKQMMDIGGCWIIDLDIRKFFDTMVHKHIREILKRRVSDGVITRLIDKWLKAGVWEAGSISYPEKGTPQGGVISPMLSNIYA